MNYNHWRGERKPSRECSVCGNPTNEEICAVCELDKQFKVAGCVNTPSRFNPASRHCATKKHQGTKRKGHTGSAPSHSQNPYLLDDLQLLILAQVGYIFDLAKEGKLKQAVKRIKLINNEVVKKI